MKSEKILDLLYDVRSENLERKEGMNGEEILKKRDFLSRFLRDNIKDEEVVNVFETVIESFTDEIYDEMERTNKEYYKYGISDYYKFQKEASSVESVELLSDAEGENLFEEWYDKRAGQIATLSEEEKEKIAGFYNKPDVNKEFAKYPQQDRDKIAGFIEKASERSNLELGYLCDKYYRCGFNDCKRLLFSN